MFNYQFVSVFSDQTDKIDYNEMTLQATMKDIIIDRNGVHKQLASLNPTKACGPDGICPRVLRELADILADPLTTLFQSSVDKGVVPDYWKRANVCPTYAKGEKYQASN